ncbi:alpha/beta hydrolase family protein [Deinococcus yavapaiensis]|uniref:Tannase/feruloyl esterase n=1 Tax=Deinococcus yavapaiensis KR-236 TaxID=694435 RepID=A0A318S9L9_9DEIO|nr:tannase/feruloyl esterase family alpha/beta hydrolase [Deinococcus yavapaiensis]PYE53782.1 tannase/feruloyl esterase [Deinococcus yavapaiensis KR-236]
MRVPPPTAWLGVLLFTACTPVPLTASAARSAFAAELRLRLQTVAPDAEVTELTSEVTRDGGMLVNGKLRGRAFALRFPPAWNRQTVLFAHGYTDPNGTPDVIPSDPTTPEVAQGLLKTVYEQGFAVGYSAFDKRGFAVTSAIENTVALKRFTDRLGSVRAYATGGSMGGSVVVLAVQRYPREFAGALAVCGVVSDWEDTVNYVTHVRALYNYFSEDTPYALPGTHDVTRALPSATMGDVTLTLLKLYVHAKLDARSQAAQILNRTLSAVPGVRSRPEFSTLVVSLLPQLVGIDDFTADAGGSILDNHETRYRSSLLSERENAALNEGIQRYRADPQAVTRFNRQFGSIGEMPVKLLTVHNAYDPLVSYEHEERLRERVARAQQLGHLAQQTLPTRNEALPLPVLSLLGPAVGAAHCGFTPQQSERAWNDLRTWVERDVKPAESFRVDLDR